MGLLPLAPLCEMPADLSLAEALRRVAGAIDRRLVAEAEHAAAVQLMTAAYVLTGLRVDRDTLAAVYQGVRIMHQSTAFDEMVDQGQVRHAHRILVQLGQIRFGPPDAATEAALTAITDLERLDRLIVAVLTADSWAQLLATH